MLRLFLMFVCVWFLIVCGCCLCIALGVSALEASVFGYFALLLLLGYSLLALYALAMFFW